jgi:hypothetical protein
MGRKITLLVGGLACLVVYALGIIGLVTTPDANAIPTPGRAVVSGVLAMFATLGVFAVGFVQTATIPD